jgi:F-type H+-transporting ATPase subunit epsilon
VPGILTYETKDSRNSYIAVDEGVLVKAGANVTVSVRRAIGGTDLGQLKAAVEREFLQVDEQELNVRNAVAKMESGLIGRLAEFEDE